MKVTGLYDINSDLFVCEKGRVPVRFLSCIKRMKHGDSWYYKMGNITAAEGSVISSSKEGKKIIFRIVGNAYDTNRFKLRRSLFAITRVVYKRVDEVLDFCPITHVLPDFLPTEKIREIDNNSWLVNNDEGDTILASVGEGYWIYGKETGISVIWDTEFELPNYSSLVVCDENFKDTVADGVRVADVVKDKDLYKLCFV